MLLFRCSDFVAQKHGAWCRELFVNLSEIFELKWFLIMCLDKRWSWCLWCITSRIGTEEVVARLGRVGVTSQVRRCVCTRATRCRCEGANVGVSPESTNSSRRSDRARRSTQAPLLSAPSDCKQPSPWPCLTSAMVKTFFCWFHCLSIWRIYMYVIFVFELVDLEFWPSNYSFYEKFAK